MNKFTFLATILQKPWVIDPDYAQSMGNFVAGILNPSLEISASPEPEANKPYSISIAQDSLKYPEGYDKAPSGSIAIIPIRGELMKQDEFCGPAGMATIGKRIQDADKHKNISATILLFDTPGGSVDGIETLSKIIKNTTKPITAFIDGTCASGGIWLASNCDKIIASNNMDRIGSIGVMTSFIDMQPVWELMGVKFHEVYSNLSKDKNRLFKEMRNGDYDNYKLEVLDPLAEEFRTIIRTNRPNANDDQLTGKMFFAKDVVGSLIDHVASFQEAIMITSELVSISKSINIKVMKELNNLSAVVGVESFEVSEGGIFLTEEQAHLINAKLESDASALSAINAEKEELINKAASNLEHENELQLTVQRLEESIENLRKAPAAKSAEVVTESNAVVKDNDPCVVNDSDDFLTRLQKVGEAYLNK